MQRISDVQRQRKRLFPCGHSRAEREATVASVIVGKLKSMLRKNGILKDCDDMRQVF